MPIWSGSKPLEHACMSMPLRCIGSDRARCGACGQAISGRHASDRKPGRTAAFRGDGPHPPAGRRGPVQREVGLFPIGSSPDQMVPAPAVQGKRPASDAREADWSATSITERFEPDMPLPATAGGDAASAPDAARGGSARGPTGTEHAILSSPTVRLGPASPLRGRRGLTRPDSAGGRCQRTTRNRSAAFGRPISG